MTGKTASDNLVRLALDILLTVSNIYFKSLPLSVIYTIVIGIINRTLLACEIIYLIIKLLMISIISPPVSFKPATSA